MSVALVQHPKGHEAYLTSLAGKANHEHRLVEQAVDGVYDELVEAVMHALTAGEALLDARRFVPEGQWTAWVQRNVDFHVDTVNQYLRLATYRSDIEKWLESGARDLRRGEAKGGFVRAALRAISSQPSLVQAADDRVRQEARRMRDAGMSFRAIGAALGVRHSTVQGWLDPVVRFRHQEQQKRRRRRARQTREEVRRGREQKERDQLVRRRASEPVAKAYAEMRRAALSLDAAIGTASGQEAEELKAARVVLYRAEDHVVKALRAARTS